MGRNSFVDLLHRYKYLRSPEEVAGFDKALQALDRSPMSSDDLRGLFGVFTDECQQHEVMWGLIHFLESVDMEKEFSAFLEALPMMRRQAPEWAKIIHCRILNDEASRTCYKKLYATASSGARQAVRDTLLEIQADDSDFASRVNQLLESERQVVPNRSVNASIESANWPKGSNLKA